MLSEIMKADDPNKKRNEQLVGLGNNAFGAAAGAYGTKAVYDQAKAKHYPEQTKARTLARQQRASDRAAARVKAGKPAFTPLKRVANKVGEVVNKVPKKYRAPAAITAAVGSQLVNAGMDAQSAAYFGRELAAGKKDVKKADRPNDNGLVHVAMLRPHLDGVGRNLNLTDEISKKVRRFDAEADRQRRLGVYEGAGAAGAATLGGLGIHQGRKTGLLTLKRLNAIQPGNRAAAALLAGSAGAAGLGLAAHHRASSARNERWN